MTTDRVTPLLRGALVPTLVVAAIALVVATIVDGLHGLWGAALGAAVVILFSGLGLLALRLVRDQDPYVLLLTALGSYTIRVILFAVTTGVIANLDGIDAVMSRTIMGLTAVACVIVWITGELRAFVKLRQPIFNFDEKKDDAAVATEDQKTQQSGGAA